MTDNSLGSFYVALNPLTPNDPYRGRTEPLPSKHCILYIYSTNIGTEYFKRVIYFPFFFPSRCSLFHNSNVFGSCVIYILYTVCAKIKKKQHSSSKCSLFYNSNLFGSCIIHILFTGVLKLKNNSGTKRLNMVYTLRFSFLFKMQFVS